MGEGRYRLHLDVVHLFEGMVENTWGINDLPPHVAIVQMANEKRLRSERIGLHIDIRASDLVEERGFAHVGVAANEQSACSRINGRKTRNVLADFLEELQSFILTLHYGSHASKGGALELLASVQTVTELEESDIVLCDLVNQMACGAQLTESQLVVILVVEDVEERGEERVEILHNGELEAIPTHSSPTTSTHPEP